MNNQLKIRQGVILGSGNRTVLVEKINSENIYLRLQHDGQRRIIPSQLIQDILLHLKSNKISLDDISRKYRKEHNLPSLFEALDLDYKNFLLGYEATISRLCEYELSQVDHNLDNKVVV